MQKADEDYELISALADGRLRGEEFARTVEWVGGAKEAQSTWHAYHVLGDVLRAGESVSCARDAAFVQRLRQGLQAETSGAAPVCATDLIAVDAMVTRAGAMNHSNRVGANAPWFGWKRLAGVASLAMVALIGWQFVFHGGAPGAAQLAQLPQPGSAPASAGADAAVMIRDPQLDALLLAHRQFGGTSALQMPAGFLRNATFEGASR